MFIVKAFKKIGYWISWGFAWFIHHVAAFFMH